MSLTVMTASLPCRKFYRKARPPVARADNARPAADTGATQRRVRRALGLYELMDLPLLQAAHDRGDFGLCQYDMVWARAGSAATRALPLTRCRHSADDGVTRQMPSARWL